MSKLLVVRQLVLILGIADGQESQARVKMLILSPVEREMEISLIAADGGKISDPVLTGNLGLSDSVEVSGREISLAISAPAAESGFLKVGEASLPEGGTDFIVLLEPAGETFNTHVVSGKMPGFGRGDTLFFNATDMSLGATLGTRKILVPPRKPIASGPSAQGRESWYQVTFYQPVEGGSVRKFGDTRWPYRDHARTYVFFYPDGPFNGVSYHVVDEMMREANNE